MNLKFSLLLALILFLVLVSVAYAAQDEPPVSGPQQLVDAAVTVVVALATFAGAIFNNFVGGIPWLNEKNKGLVKTAVTQLLTVVVSLATGYVSFLVANGLGFVEDVGLRSVIITTLTAVFVELRYRIIRLQPMQAKPYRG